ncbi:Rnf-Nqr domain containing protein [Marispirochaeta aestuarii]|uniref:Rnf-Nqr domain containing protein n=1 Tax=Marispirochaeta aestuarii TaxID=1963862 RepID=UPI0037494AE8
MLGRAEAFASKKQEPCVQSVMDGLGMGVGFTLGSFCRSPWSVRFFGNGTITIFPIATPSALTVSI